MVFEAISPAFFRRVSNLVQVNQQSIDSQKSQFFAASKFLEAIQSLKNSEVISYFNQHVTGDLEKTLGRRHESKKDWILYYLTRKKSEKRSLLEIKSDLIKQRLKLLHDRLKQILMQIVDPEVHQNGSEMLSSLNSMEEAVRSKKKMNYLLKEYTQYQKNYENARNALIKKPNLALSEDDKISRDMMLSAAKLKLRYIKEFIENRHGRSFIEHSNKIIQLVNKDIQKETPDNPYLLFIKMEKLRKDNPLISDAGLMRMVLKKKYTPSENKMLLKVGADFLADFLVILLTNDNSVILVNPLYRKYEESFLYFKRNFKSENGSFDSTAAFEAFSFWRSGDSENGEIGYAFSTGMAMLFYLREESKKRKNAFNLVNEMPQNS